MIAPAARASKPPSSRFCRHLYDPSHVRGVHDDRGDRGDHGDHGARDDGDDRDDRATGTIR